MTKKEFIKVEKEKFEVAIEDIKLVKSFLDGMSVGLKDTDFYNINNNATKLSNAIQWLHNWPEGKK